MTTSPPQVQSNSGDVVQPSGETVHANEHVLQVESRQRHVGWWEEQRTVCLWEIFHNGAFQQLSCLLETIMPGGRNDDDQSANN